MRLLLFRCHKACAAATLPTRLALAVQILSLFESRLLLLSAISSQDRQLIPTNRPPPVGGSQASRQAPMTDASAAESLGKGVGLELTLTVHV
jgi:hypothetical protein